VQWEKIPGGFSLGGGAGEKSKVQGAQLSLKKRSGIRGRSRWLVRSRRDGKNAAKIRG